MNDDKNIDLSQQKRFILSWYNLLDRNTEIKLIIYLEDFYNIICKIEKKRFPNSNVRAINPDLAKNLENQYLANRLVTYGDSYPTMGAIGVSIPSFLVGGNEYVRMEELLSSEKKSEVKYYWYLIEPVEMSEVYEEAKALLRHLNDILLTGPITARTTIVLPEMKKEVENIITYIETNCVEKKQPSQ